MAFFLLLLAVTSAQTVVYIPLPSEPTSCNTFLKLELVSSPGGIRSWEFFFFFFPRCLPISQERAETTASDPAHLCHWLLGRLRFGSSGKSERVHVKKNAPAPTFTLTGSRRVRSMGTP